MGDVKVMSSLAGWLVGWLEFNGAFTQKWRHRAK